MRVSSIRNRSAFNINSPWILLAIVYMTSRCTSIQMGQSRMWTQTIKQGDGNSEPNMEETYGEEHLGYIGCLFSGSVCGYKEICFNDGLFGQCMSEQDAAADNGLKSFEAVSELEKDRIMFEVNELLSQGFDWSDSYTQCFIQTNLEAILNNLDADVTSCNVFKQIDFMPASDELVFSEENEPLDPTISEQQEDWILPPLSDIIGGPNNEQKLVNDEELLSENEPPYYPLNDYDYYNDNEENRPDDLPVDLYDDYNENKTVAKRKEREKHYDDDYYYYDNTPDELIIPISENRNKEIGSSIFNRNERLDVKKPGPFYTNSANNFYLDELLNDENQHSNKTTNSNAALEDEIGQLEYEIPFSTSLSKKKRDRNNVNKQHNPIRSDISAVPTFVHIGFKKRFDTYKQGKDLIDYLAHEFNLPDSTLSDKEIADHHVQFNVRPNFRNVDAIVMVKRLNNDDVLKKRINSEFGIGIDRAIAGDDRSSNVRPILSSLRLEGTNMIVAAIMSAAIAAMLVGFTILFIKRKRIKFLSTPNELEKGKMEAEYKQMCRDWSKSSTKANKQSHCSSPKSNSNDTNSVLESNHSSTSSWPEELTIPNMDISTGHMVLSYMEDHLKNKQRLEQEWVALCGYEADPCATTVAFKAENKKKNRFPDKLPYDHNRIKLNSIVSGSKSDYINASSLTDHDPRNPSYIATQGPLANSVADFWQMIWEQGCVVIVMLTRLQDKVHNLCHRYWPEQGSEQYHIFEVNLVSEHVWCDDYLVRSVYLKNSRTGETRTVTQFHYKSWPETGIPTSTKSLLEFRRKVNKSYRGRSCPIVVHCSDGVGRTGAYVLIDMVLNRINKGCKEMDIAAALEHIRDQRGGMVKNRQQFEFCLTAVAEDVHAMLKAMPQ